LVATQFQLNWKKLEVTVEGGVLWGLAGRRWYPLQIVGIDEASRRKGQQRL
jgi:hypothetical protein